MRKHYDFSELEAKPNPYIARLTKEITLRLDRDVLEYLKEIAEETGIPYQTLINNYLRDCAVNERKLRMEWEPN
jgi:uncharacterized protein (DUF4415 family)